jgi:tRNA (guanine37-N1)-methyltransferase
MTFKSTFKIAVITLFPEMFAALNFGVIGRAFKQGISEITYLNPRDEATRNHGYIDDAPYGGGPGMIMQAEPLLACIRKADKTLPDAYRILLTPTGQPLTHEHVKTLSQHRELIMVCGRYEGIDQRFTDLANIDLELSIGDFVLSGGEIAAMALIDACIRQQPHALGDAQSADQDSFCEGLLEAPQYTRPKMLENKIVPSILLSGNHAAICQWQRKQALGRTWQYRPDLLNQLELSSTDQALLSDYQNELNQGEEHE